MKALVLILAICAAAAPISAAERTILHSQLPQYSSELVARLLDPKGADYDPLLACQILRRVAFDTPEAAFRLFKILESGVPSLKPKPDIAEFWLVHASNRMYPPAMKEFGLRMLIDEGNAPDQYLVYELLYAASAAGEDVGIVLRMLEKGLSKYFVDAVHADGGKSVTTFGFPDTAQRLSQPACEKSL